MEETVELPKKKRTAEEICAENRKQHKDARKEIKKAFWDKIPENGVVLLFLSHICRFAQEDEDERELEGNEREVFKIPTRRLKMYTLEFLQDYSMEDEIPAAQVWIDLEIRLTHKMGLDGEADEEDIKIRGGSLKDCKWTAEKGPLVTPQDVVTHAFSIEC